MKKMTEREMCELIIEQGDCNGLYCDGSNEKSVNYGTNCVFEGEDYSCNDPVAQAKLCLAKLCVEEERPAEQMDDDIQTLVDHMHRKLLLNDHKPNWKDYTDRYIFECILVEVDELEEALILGNSGGIAKEIADVANYCMMMISNIKRRVKGKEAETH